MNHPFSPSPPTFSSDPDPVPVPVPPPPVGASVTGKTKTKTKKKKKKKCWFICLIGILGLYRAVYHYQHQLISSSEKSLKSSAWTSAHYAAHVFVPETRPCVESKTWGVITTIFEVNEAVRLFTSTFEDTCLVVVGDLKTEETDWREFELIQSNVIYLSPDDQKNLPFAIVKYLPWNHFGRKNIGFLVAIANKAEFIFDFDDDNHLNIRSFAEIENMNVVKASSTGHHIYNPYPFFEPEVKGKEVFCWPRGQPLQFINDPDTFALDIDISTGGKDIQVKDLAIVQSLADHDPDVDAIYRMTRPLPVYFKRKDTIVVPPPKAFVPLNAQAVIFKEAAFFGLLLPTSVNGRVSDIWRGYIAVRLLWETPFKVGFSSPIVTQYRNPHSYMEDYIFEKGLYEKTDEFLKALAGETSEEDLGLDQTYLHLISILVELELLERSDLELATAWVSDLNQYGYKWPAVTNHYDAFLPRTSTIVDERFIANENQNIPTVSKFQLGETFAEGVLPIRRFVIIGGQKIATLDLKEATQCNGKCLENAECDAWQLDNEACHLFADSKTQPLDIYQANDNDPQFVVGFIQRRAKVLRPTSSADDTIISKRVLYILHFHHEVIPHAYKKIVNEILPSSWQSNMDLVVITPREIDLEVYGIHASGSSLRNPFLPKSETSRRGANGQMSLPIARAKFPGYGGYLLVNDDAMLKNWDLNPDVWFGDRPWGTFAPSKYSKQKWVPRQIKARYPYGPYGWSWFNYDSGSAGERFNATRSNFDAALAALNELCRDKSITRTMDDSSLQEFCTNRTESTVMPFCNGKADALYVPGSDLGTAMSKAMTLFGEHDVFMEIAYPMIYNLLVPREKVLEMPYCDGTSNELAFVPYFQVTREEGRHLDCPVIHPIKFGKENAIVYWKEVVEEKCSWCEWKNENQTYWKIVD